MQHRKLVLLLDYDGTLTPIVKDPSKALLSERVSRRQQQQQQRRCDGLVVGMVGWW